MRLKELQSELQSLKGFTTPNSALEQYVTSAHLASQMIFSASNQFGDIEDRCVLDLGCGTCILGIAARLEGAAHVMGVDLDDAALETAKENLIDMELEEEIDLLQAKVTPGDQSSVLEGLIGKFDTVIMNPPFGTKTPNIDMVFLERACQIANTAVYSLHKSSTRAHILKRAKNFGFEAQVVAQMRYDLPKTMRFHKQTTKDIEVDFIRFERVVEQ